MDKMIMSKPLDSEMIILITILLLLPLFFIFLKKVMKSPYPPLPPTPNSWPIIATINHLLHPLTHTSLANLAQSYGPLMHFNLGTQHLIVASSPAAAAAILKVNDRALSSRSVPHSLPLTPYQINNLSFWADPISDHWKNIRTICRTELFSAKALEAQARMRDEKAGEMVEKLRLKEGVESDVGLLVYGAVVNMMSHVLFSSGVFGLGDEFECNKVRGLLRGIIGALFTPNLSDFYPFLRVFDLQGLRKKHREFSIKLWEMWNPIVKERRRNIESEFIHDDFLDKLIAKGFGDDQINHLLEELLTAGIDTTTSTINRTMIELMTTPEAMTNLKHELDAAFDHQAPLTSSHIENLPYLEACVKETLRLHPPAPLLLAHRAGEMCRVMDHTIPKNARVLVNVWAIGRDPTVWEDALEYRPERFLNSCVDFKGNDFEFLPFGAGRRICPGMPMATKIVPVIVASLVYFFDWEGSVDHNFIETAQIKVPLLLVPRPRPRPPPPPRK